MEKIKIIYHYIFYILYRNAKKSSSVFPHRFVAELSLNFLEFIFIISFIYYFDINLEKKIYFIIIFSIIFFNYFIFNNIETSLQYIDRFDKFSKEKNKKYKTIVWTGIIFIIINLVCSIYSMDKRAKKNQIGPYAPEIIAKKRKEDSLQRAQQIENLKKIYGEDKK